MNIGESRRNILCRNNHLTATLRAYLRFARLLMAAALSVLVSIPLSSMPVQAATKTIVSLNFDDGLASQTAAQTALDNHGMKGTFYLISGALGTSGHLSIPQALALQSDGQDIGGHTITHPDLPTLTASQQQHEICDGRSQLSGFGLTPSTLAYPFGDYNSTSEQIAKNCGFSGARAIGGIDCSGCDTAEAVPPADPFAIQTPDSIKSNTSLSTIEGYVTKAENNGGGLVVLVMHDVCATSTSGCDPTYSINPSRLNNFLAWLKARNTKGTTVETMSQIMGKGSTLPPPPPPSSALQNPSLETDTTGSVVPDCWQEGGFGTNAPSWVRTNDAHSGSWAETLKLTSLTDGDAKLVTQQHDPTCEPTGTAGHTYSVSAWYKSNQPVHLVAYYLDSTGVWQFWDQSDSLAASTAYTKASWTTPAFPSGATKISIGLSLRTIGSVTMDDFGLLQN